MQKSCALVSDGRLSSMWTAQVELVKPLGIRFARGSDGGAYVTRSDPNLGNTDTMVQVHNALSGPDMLAAAPKCSICNSPCELPCMPFKLLEASVWYKNHVCNKYMCLTCVLHVLQL